MITVSADPGRKLVRAVMSGLLTVEDAQRFSREEQAAVRQMGLASGEFFLLVETEGNVIQTQEVMAAFQALVFGSSLKAKRIATVRSGALGRIQSRRVTATRDHAAVFDGLVSAEAWLFS